MVNQSCSRYCGKMEAATIIAGNWLTVTFTKTQPADNEMNFTMQYSILWGSDIHINNNESYYLESSDHPDDYEPFKKCEWYIRAPYKHYLSIKFDYFELEESEGCRKDFLEARENRNRNAPFIGTYCGRKVNLEIVSFMHHMYLMFYSDSSKQTRGFSAIISAIPI
ncbi:hypothetical protein KQX54_008343 [Cotesia glomerata]|uniref:CUB domain-containing protein n=1 Tax=Cotesia glomerata TaxID=32391 RepID=A0AAV7IXR3_COTGL|nr:hypothetical protein KQX54_008343 [Cotesia glomerata]